MTTTVNVLNWLFGLPLWGTGLWARYLYIILMALLGAAIALFLFKRLSRQQRLARLRSRIRGNIMQLSIYPDRFGIVLSSLGAVLADTARSLAESVLPLILISIPLSMIMLEVNNHCGSEPLASGEEFVIHAVLDNSALTGDIDIAFSPNIEPATSGLRIPELQAVYWRARVLENAGDTDSFVRLTGDGSTVEVPVVTIYRQRTFGPRTMRPSIPGGLTSNANGFLAADSSFKSVTIAYDRAAYPLLWWHLDALTLYIILTLIAAVILKPFIGVQF